MNVMFLKRIQMMLALLFVGSASMLADDLFPGDPEHKYQNYKRLVGKVLLNGEELTSEAVIAAYAGDEAASSKLTKGLNIRLTTITAPTTTPTSST